MKIYGSSYPPVAIPDESIFTWLFSTHFTDSPPSAPAFIDAATGKTVTRAELKELAFSFAWGLREEFPKHGGLPLKRGDTVMIFSPNSIAWPVMLFGSWAAGLRTTLANSNYTARELEHQLKDSGAQVVLTHPALVPLVVETLCRVYGSESEARKRIIVADWGNSSGDKVTANFVRMSDLIGKSSIRKEEKFPGQQAHETTLLCYSSGTTGKPKGVETTHRNLVSEIIAVHTAFIPTSEDDRILGVLPFFHIYGVAQTLIMPVRRGVTVVIMPKYDPVDYCKYIEKYRVTILFAVPPIFLALARHEATMQYDLRSLRYCSCGAAPLGGPLVNELRAKLKSVGVNPWLTQGFGTTETSPVTHLLGTTNSVRKPDSVGFLLSNLEARIVLENDGDAEEGEPGELWLRGPNVMKGYLNNPQATKNSLTSDGWYKTGDVARRDSEGLYYIVDRMKELIKYKGFQVPPAELESVLLQHPEIAAAAVIGVYSDEEATELPRAYVVPTKGRKSVKPVAFAREVQKWIEPRVARHKYLRGGVAVVDSIPVSASGKILRRELYELAKKELSGQSQIRAKL